MIDVYVSNSADDGNPQQELHFVYDSAYARVPQHVTHLRVRSILCRIEPRTFKCQNKLQEVEIEEGVQEIGEAAFQWCSMRTLSTPLSMVNIGKEAFYGSKLTEINLNVGLKDIGRYAFCCCPVLEKITVPSTVETIGESAFNGCIRLVDVCLLQEEGRLKQIGRSAFNECSSLVDVLVPSTVDHIHNEMFWRCSSLKNVVLGNNTRRIDWRGFADCPALEHVSCGFSLEIVDSLAFGNCFSLCYVDLPSTLEHIGEEAFASCTSLSAVSIPASMETIGRRAFAGCTSLLGVEMPKNRNICFYNGVFEGCTSLISIINMWVPPLIEEFTIDHTLDEESIFYDDQADVPFHRLRGRFAHLPVHRACYHASSSSVEEILAQIELSKTAGDSDIKDEFGLTPFHILATSARPRLDVLQALLNHYPWDLLSVEDSCENTMMDYLLKNRVPRSIEVIRAILKDTIGARVDTWGVERWKLILMQKIESKDWNGDFDDRLRAFVEVIKTFESISTMYMTSLLELALWKTKTLDFTIPSGIKRKRIERENDRMVCGADVVIPNVVGYLWDSSDQQVGDVASLFFDYDVSWMRSSSQGTHGS